MSYTRIYDYMNCVVILMSNLVEMQDIVKRFPGVLANDHISFDLRPGETHALVGENGAGKSTLMKILYGQYTPDQGTIRIRGQQRQYDVTGARSLGIGMVYQNFMQIPNMSILENIILGHTPARLGLIRRREAHHQVSCLLQRFGMKCSPDKAIQTLSIGERQKVEIIKALYFGAEILILDEPTAVLTPQETAGLFQIIRELKAEGKSIVFISHKLREVTEISDRITVMRKGRVVRAGWQKREASETEIARAMIGRQDVQLLKNDRSGPVGAPVLEARHLWYFDGDGVAKVRDLSFSVRAGEILGIGGVEGNGQTELLNLLIGTDRPSGGSLLLCRQDITDLHIRQRREAGLAYISDDRMTTGLSLDGDLPENLICGRENLPPFSRYGILQKKEIERYAAEMAAKFDIRGVHPGKPVRSLSGGNMQKIVLAREIDRKPQVLVAAQPTRGLDIGAINFVRRQLLDQKEAGAAVLLVSADLEELMSLSDRMIILFDGGCSGEITEPDKASEEEIGLLMGGVVPEGRGKEDSL